MVVPRAAVDNGFAYAIDGDDALERAARRKIVKHALAGAAQHSPVGAMTHDGLDQAQRDVCAVHATVIFQRQPVLAAADALETAAVVVQKERAIAHDTRRGKWFVGSRQPTGPHDFLERTAHHGIRSAKPALEFLLHDAGCAVVDKRFAQIALVRRIDDRPGERVRILRLVDGGTKEGREQRELASGRGTHVPVDVPPLQRG